MSLTESTETTAAQRRDALADRLFNALIETTELTSVYLGQRLSLYRTLREGGPATASEFATRAGIDQRYAREWLEQQAVAGFIHTGPGDAASRVYSLPAEHAEVLLDADHPSYAGAAAFWVGSIVESLPHVLHAYATGTGVPYTGYGADIRDAIGLFNRPMFSNELSAWIAAVPGLQQRLESGARVLDIGCGVGYSTIELARTFPKSRIEGLDADEASIADARRNAEQAGLGDRVTFRVANAAELTAGGEAYDVIFMFETLHDMARPFEALQAARAALTDGGVLVIAEEKVAESFTAPGDEVERLNYGFSFWHCLPASRAEEPSAAVGTVLRPDVLLGWAREAGYGRAEVVPVDNDLWRFYRLERGAS